MLSYQVALCVCWTPIGSSFLGKLANGGDSARDVSAVTLKCFRMKKSTAIREEASGAAREAKATRSVGVPQRPDRECPCRKGLPPVRATRSFLTSLRAAGIFLSVRALQNSVSRLTRVSLGYIHRLLEKT